MFSIFENKTNKFITIMKKITLTIIMLISVFGFSQSAIKSTSVKTTYNEYSYLTERYGLEDNVKMLEGYEFKHLEEVTYGKFNYNYQLFIETETGKTKAVFITITKIKKNDDKVKYLCMPINNAELFKKFHDEAELLGVSMSIGFEGINQAILSKLIDSSFN